MENTCNLITRALTTATKSSNNRKTLAWFSKCYVLKKAGIVNIRLNLKKKKGEVSLMEKITKIGESYTRSTSTLDIQSVECGPIGYCTAPLHG